MLTQYLVWTPDLSSASFVLKYWGNGVHPANELFSANYPKTFWAPEKWSCFAWIGLNSWLVILVKRWNFLNWSWKSTFLIPSGLFWFISVYIYTVWLFLVLLTYFTFTFTGRYKHCDSFTYEKKDLVTIFMLNDSQMARMAEAVHQPELKVADASLSTSSSLTFVFVSFL